jgi:putative oxidoreductase
MERIEKFRIWAVEHRDAWLDVLRLDMGIALFLKALSFTQNMSEFVSQMPVKSDAFLPVLLAHFIILAHLAGGVMLFFGICTRLAAALQVPILAGAVFFVHWNEGLFQPAQTLEFVLLVLFILVLLAVAGGGRWSVDEQIRRNEAEQLGALAPSH